MKEISLTQDQIALVDDEDFERINQFRWCASWDSKAESFYAVRRDGAGTMQMARFTTGCPDDMMVDHKNHDTLDNQKHNLRVCTSNQNSMNRKKSANCSSRYKGVSWDSTARKWKAMIGLRDIFDQYYMKYLGTFKIEEDAALAYDEAAWHYFGEFAYLNFPTRFGNV